MQTDETGRRIDLNTGFISDPRTPDNREIVGAFFILRDEDRNFSVYLTDGDTLRYEDVKQPEPEVSIELAAHIAQAFQLANL